LGSLW